MILIFGTKIFEKVMAVIGPFRCTRCGNTAQFRIVRSGHWFTLFFIPLFPFSSKYYRVCGACSNAEELDKETAKGIIGRVSGSPPADSGKS